MATRIATVEGLERFVHAGRAAMHSSEVKAAKTSSRSSFNIGFGVGFSAGLGYGLGLRRTVRPRVRKAPQAAAGRVLLSRGEIISVRAPNSTAWTPVIGALLDTGNEARTLISETVARTLGLHPQHNATTAGLTTQSQTMMRSTNGTIGCYPTTQFILRIGDDEVETDVIEGAIGGMAPVLVGRDVLSRLGDRGYTVRAM